MCDNPTKNPWEVYVDPKLVREILPGILDRIQEKGIEKVELEIPVLKKIPRKKLLKFLKGIEQEKVARTATPESDLAHVEFDIQRLKKLPEAELRKLLQNKLVPRIIEDIKKFEVERPVPDWCYAFF